MEEDIFSSEIDSYIEDLYQSSYQNGHQNGNLQRKLSRMSLSVPTKGLLNGPGDNNCYLNASVQLLWHMDVFRRSFRLLKGHACLENACIFCALKNLFQQFQDSQASVLTADQLRKALANAFMDDQRFQLGRMADAAECFENILNRLHNHIANAELAETCSVKYCIPHQKFGQHILEQTSCQCKATSEPSSFYQFVHYVSASALVELVQSNSSDTYERTFGENLKMIMTVGERRPCPDERRCLYKGKQPVATVQKTLINCPDVVTIGIIWDSDHPSAKFISSFMDSIGDTLYLVDLFDNIADDEHRRIGLNLSGVVAYYGKHYTSFFYNSKDKRWYYFDDENVQDLGSEWKNVKGKFSRSRFQPLLLTYTNANGHSVDTEQAPTSVSIVSKERLLYRPPSPTNHPQKPKGRHKKQRRHHHTSSTDKLLKTVPDEACMTCDKNGASPTSSPRRSPRTSKKTTPSKATHSTNSSNHNTQTSSEIGPRFGHNTFVSRDLNSTFAATTTSSGSAGTTRPSSYKERKSVDPTSLQNHHQELNGGKNGSADSSETSGIHKTGEFLRKTLNQTLNHIKKSKSNSNSTSTTSSSKNLKPVREQEHSVPEAIVSATLPNFADAGFDSHNSNSNTNTKSRTKTLPAYRIRKNSNSQEKSSSNSNSNHEQGKQLQNLEKHHEAISNHSKSKSSDLVNELNSRLHSSSSTGSSLGTDSASRQSSGEPQPTQQPPPNYAEASSAATGELSLCIPEVVELTSDDDMYFQQGDFEALVNQGENYANESEKWEREGNIESALSFSIKAKNAFHYACQVQGISKDVTQFAELKYLQWAQKEKIHQQRLNFASIQQKVDSVLSSKENKSSTSSEEYDLRGAQVAPDHEPRQQSNESRTASLKSSSNHSSRSRTGSNADTTGTTKSTSKSSSSNRVESIYDRGRTSPESSQAPPPRPSQPPSRPSQPRPSTKPQQTETGFGLFSSPTKSNSTNLVGATPASPKNGKSNVVTGPLKIGVTPASPKHATTKPTNTIEKLRHSSQHNPKLYDPSAYTNKLRKDKPLVSPTGVTSYEPETIYDSPVLSRKSSIGLISQSSPPLSEKQRNEDSTVAELMIVENLRRFTDTKDSRPSRCEHCGWKMVENNAKLCFSCQSYI